MAHITMLLTSYWEKLGQIVTGLFAIIPQIIYFLYASMASLMDFLQLCVRKIAGLDVYYVNGDAVSGDILKDFFEGILGINSSYGSLNTVFWSLVIFGCIVLVLSTIFAIIKSHYDSNYENTNPWKIIVKAVRALCMMVIVPIVTIFGIKLCEIFLQTLDNITTQSNMSVYEKPENEYDVGAIGNFKYNTNSSGQISYSSYDMFGVTEWTSTATFSGMLFELICTDANRVRIGEYTATNTAANSDWDNCNVFYSNTDNAQSVVAEQIDYAFKNCLTLNNAHSINVKGSECKIIIGSSLTIGPSAFFRIGLNNVTKFSKFNIGLVWYYYNLWGANYFLGFAGVILLLVILINLVFGLIKRLLISIVLFLIAPPIIGITPLDDGNGFKSWTKTFISYIIACFGAVIGMNLFFLILPVLMNISLFNMAFIDKIFNIIIVFAGLTMIKNLMAMISSFIGSADLQAEGGSLKGDVGKMAMSGLKGVMAAANLEAGVFKYATGASLTGKAVGKVAGKIGTGISNNISKMKTAIADKKKERPKKKAIRKDAWRTIRTYFMTADEAEVYTNQQQKKDDKKNIKAILKSDLSDEDKVAEIAKIDQEFDTKDALDKQKRKQENLAKFSTAIGNGVGTMFSSRDKDGKLKKTGLAAIKDYALDLSGGVYQFVGDTTGIKNIIGSLVKEGINDQAKEVVQSFAPSNLSSKMKSGDLGKHFQTKEQKEKQDKDKEEALDRKYREIANNSKQTADNIAKLTKLIGEKSGDMINTANKAKAYNKLSVTEQKEVASKIKKMQDEGRV